MQRALSYAQSPGLAIPLRFLLTAPFFSALAGLLLLFVGGPAFDSRWTPAALAATHLLTLGVLSMAMAGSILQLIPVVAGHQLRAAPATGMLAWLGLAAATMTLSAAFLTRASWLFAVAAGAIAIGVGALVLAVVGALARPAPAGSRPMVIGMRLALAALAVTVALGMALALALTGTVPLPLLALTDLHVAWGLIGWIAVLVVSVGFQVIPMFQGVSPYPAAMTKAGAGALAGLLCAWSVAHWLGWRSAMVPGLLAALCLAGFAAFTLRRMAMKRKPAEGSRKPADGTTLYWRLSLSCLAASAALYCLPVEHAILPSAIGVLFIAGFAIGAVNGMLYKIVPFLLWYHLQSNPLAKKGDVPTIRAILPEQSGRIQFCCHALALLALLGALWWPDLLGRAAGALFAFASARLLRDLLQACRGYRRVQDKLQPS